QSISRGSNMLEELSTSSTTVGTTGVGSIRSSLQIATPPEPPLGGGRLITGPVPPPPVGGGGGGSKVEPPVSSPGVLPVPVPEDGGRRTVFPPSSLPLHATMAAIAAGTAK